MKVWMLENETKLLEWVKKMALVGLILSIIYQLVYAKQILDVLGYSFNYTLAIVFSLVSDFIVYILFFIQKRKAALIATILVTFFNLPYIFFDMSSVIRPFMFYYSPIGYFVSIILLLGVILSCSINVPMFVRYALSIGLTVNGLAFYIVNAVQRNNSIINMIQNDWFGTLNGLLSRLIVAYCFVTIILLEGYSESMNKNKIQAQSTVPTITSSTSYSSEKKNQIWENNAVSITDSLIQLENLLDNQLITQEEYDTKRKKIIDGI